MNDNLRAAVPPDWQQARVWRCRLPHNYKSEKTGEGVGLCQIAKHLNLTHGVNHTPLRCSRTQDNCFITDLAWSVSNRASQIFLLRNQIVLVLLPPLLSLSYCTFETLPFSMCLCNILIYFNILPHLTLCPDRFLCDLLTQPLSIWDHSFLNQFSGCIKGQWRNRPCSALSCRAFFNICIWQFKYLSHQMQENICSHDKQHKLNDEMKLKLTQILKNDTFWLNSSNT